MYYRIDERYRRGLMPIFSLISKFLELIDRIQTLVNKLWIRLTEEWMFLEGKFTIIGTFVLIKVLLIVGILRFSFPISLGFDSLLQSFVSLLAIVPAISLAVMEISASSYSIKLSRIYRKNVYFWYLIVLYITVIIISIFGQLYSSLSMLNTMTTILAIFGILYIVPFFLAIMRLLEPKRAIESLGQQVKVESILSTISQKPISLIPPSGDPLYPLLEIALEAVNRMDIETLRLTLDETLKRYSKVLIALERERPGRKATAGEVLIEAKVTHQMREVIEHFLNHLRSLKSVSFERKYEQNVICLVEYFGRFCEETMNYRFIEASHGNNRPAFSWMYEIVDFGTKCLVVGFWDGSACSLRVLSELSEKAIRQRYSGLQHAIADFVKELSTNGMRIPHLPMHFVPSVALHSMSSVVVAKMKYGVYDVELNHQIEDFNKLSLEIIEKTALYIYGPILSRCYEKMLSIALFDYYREKGEDPGQVAKVLWDTLQIQAPYLMKTLPFLREDRKLRRVCYPMSYYDPKEAIEDLLSKGIGKITITAANLNKGIYVAEMCSNIRELSRIFYELKDQKMIDTVSNLVYRVLVSFKTSRDFRLGNLEQMLCAMGYAALYKGFGASVTDIFSYLETIAESAIEKSPERALRIAMLIGYLGAAGLDFRMLDATNSALRKIIKFEEKFSARHGCLPELNHITLLVRNYPVTSRTWSRDAPYLNRENIYWLFRLSAEKIDTERKLVTDKAIEEFHSMYLTNFLPKGY